MARSLHALRGTLVDADLDCASVAEREECAERGRWRDLAKLEAVYRQTLEQVGLVDVNDAKRDAATGPELPDGISRVVLMGVTDLIPLVQSALGQLIKLGGVVELVVFGPRSGEAFFDDWGRPIPGHWCERELSLENENLHPALDEKTQAAEITGVLTRYGDAVYDSAAVGSADSSVIPYLECEFSRAALRGFNPAGSAVRRASVVAFLKSLLAVLQSPTYTNADAFLRLPDSWAWLKKLDESIAPTPLLLGLDEVREKHLPVSLAASSELNFEKESEKDNIGRRILARTALRHLQNELRAIEGDESFQRLLEFLKQTFAGREFHVDNEDDALCVEVIRLLKDRLACIEVMIPPKAKRDVVAELTLLIDSLGRESLVTERPSDTIDLQGWLELAWEDAPHLLVAGVNEGVLPESIHGDRFLPESLRKQLGLRTNEDRFARDAWLLELLVSVRAKRGRVDLFVGRQRVNGDPLKPSRLLFRCDDSGLPSRVDHLFAPLPPLVQAPAWSVPWKLSAADAKPPERLGVTAMADYLSCPYRFFLKHVRRMQALDIDQRELDPRGFGNLIHGVLDEYGRDESMSNVFDPKKINAYFTEKLNAQVKRRFGNHLSLPLIVQSEIAAKRLSVVASIQAEELKAGWRIIGTEEGFELEIGGMLVRGRIDRIEKNEETGEVRVLDYKTSSTASDPAKKHWIKYDEAKHGEWTRDYARFEVEGKSMCWVGLQLPLYAMALEENYGNAILLGYFNIPEVGADVGVRLLNPSDTTLLEAANKCAIGVVNDVKSGRFWPPNPKPMYDDYKSILFDDGEGAALEPGREANP